MRREERVLRLRREREVVVAVALGERQLQLELGGVARLQHGVHAQQSHARRYSDEPLASIR